MHALKGNINFMHTLYFMHCYFNSYRKQNQQDYYPVDNEGDLISESVATYYWEF